MFLGERSAAQVAQVRSHARVHRAQMPAQHLAQQEATPALAALKPALAAVRQHVTCQLAAPRALPRAHVADEFLLLVHGVDVVRVAGVRLEHGPAQRALHRTFLPHRPGRRLLLLGGHVERLVDQAVHAQEERVFHAASALRTLVGLRVGGHVHQQVLLGPEAALADRTLVFVARDLHQSVVEVRRGGRVGRRVRLGLEVAHVVHAHVPAQLLDGRADLRALGALERRHRDRLLQQLRVQVQPVVRRVLKRGLLVAVHDALVALQARDVAEALAAVVTRLTGRHDTVLLGK